MVVVGRTWTLSFVQVFDIRLVQASNGYTAAWGTTQIRYALARKMSRRAIPLAWLLIEYLQDKLRSTSS